MNTDMNATENRNSQSTARSDNDLLEMLAILIIGGIAILLSLDATEANDPWIYALSVVLLFVMAGCSILMCISMAVKCIDLFLDLKERFKKAKDQS